MGSKNMKCYYCGELSDDANDHVPPEVLFKGFSPNNYKGSSPNRVGRISIEYVASSFLSRVSDLWIAVKV
jgi:hypothetical protein